MRNGLFLLLLLSASMSWAQTASHQPIAGTKYSMIPPAEFVPATRFSGFQHNTSGASIMVTEIPGPFDKVTEGFTETALKSKGITLIGQQTIDFNNAKALYVTLSQPGNGTVYLKQILAFGDTKKTVLVNGIYPEAAKALENDIKKALLTTTWNENQKDNPLDAARFSIDTAGTDFKFVHAMSGTLLYSTDGKVPTESPVLIVANSIGQVSAADQKQYSINRIKQLPRGEQIVIKTINAIEVDHLPGYEIVANGKNKHGKDQLVYQVMLFNGATEYYLIIGMAADDQEKNLQTYKSITKTFKRK
jgi:hypothetical protein